MVRLEIGIHEREGLNNIEESWVTKTVNGYRRNGENCCVKIQIKETDLDLNLATPDCSRGIGGRTPNEQESKVVDLWKKHHLHESCEPGNVIAFIKQLKNIL